MLNSPLDHEDQVQDFVVHLQTRLGLEDEASAVAALGNWLSSYQPGPVALARGAALPSLRRNAA